MALGVAIISAAVGALAMWWMWRGRAQPSFPFAFAFSVPSSPSKGRSSLQGEEQGFDKLSPNGVGDMTDWEKFQRRRSPISPLSCWRACGV